LALLAVLALHVALVAYAWGKQLPLSDIPLNKGDFSTHAEQVRAVIEGLQGWGQHWVYDVRLLAGTPSGVLFDADVKGWELFTYALVELGYPQGWAYNLHALLIHLCLPLCVYASARLVRLDAMAATIATALCVLLWSYDSFTHWMWSIGTVTYCAVAYFCLLPLALFWRWLEDRRAWAAVACAVALALGHLEHPYLFFILVWPMLALWWRAGWVERTLTWRGQLTVIAIAATTLLVNGWWLRTALQFFHYILDSAYYEQGGIEFVFWDLVGLLHDSSTQGMIGPRVSVRLFALVCAIAGLRRWRASADRRRLPFLVLIVSMAAIAFLGGYTPFAQIQPYRHNLVLGFALVIPAGWWLRELIRERAWRSLTTDQRVLGGALALLAALMFVRDALYFHARSLRDRQHMEDGSEVLMDSLGHAFTPRYDYDEQNDWEPIIAYIRANDDGRLRWLVGDQVLGEYLIARTDAQIMGGFLVLNLEHSDANWVRHNGAPPYDVEEFKEYLRTYAVGWIVINRRALHEWWDQHPELFARAALVGDNLVLRIKLPVSLIEGRGRVKSSTNRIEVTRSDPNEDILLRYHWLETLRCTPDCTIERVPLEHDRVGFMRIPAPHPRDFVIENGY
jgi:hypothetical protein